MTKNIACPVCNGKGYVYWVNSTEDTCSTGSKTCPHCDGTGIREVAFTNADRIRAMSDEELAILICKAYECYRCPGEELCNCVEGKANGAMKWLQQPVEVERCPN